MYELGKPLYCLFDLTDLSDGDMDLLDESREYAIGRQGELYFEEWAERKFKKDQASITKSVAMLKDVYGHFGCDIRPSNTKGESIAVLSPPVHQRTFKEWREKEIRHLMDKRAAAAKEQVDKEQKWGMDYRLKWAGWVVALLGLLAMVVIRASQK